MRREKGSGSIYKRDGSPVWWIKYHRHGRPFRESTHATDWNKAGRMLKIVSRSDMNDAILKLQESENRVEQERLRTEERQEEIRAQIGHNDAVSPKPPASRAVN